MEPESEFVPLATPLEVALVAARIAEVHNETRKSQYGSSGTVWEADECIDKAIAMLQKAEAALSKLEQPK